MKQILMTALLCCLAFASAGAQTNTPAYSRAKVFFDDDHTFLDLVELGIDGTHGRRDRTRAWYETDFSAEELQAIRAKGFMVNITIDDVQKYYQDQNLVDSEAKRSFSPTTGCASKVPLYPKPTNFNLGSMGGYFTYQEILDNLDQMRTLYPNLITVKTVINPNDLSIEGRPIYYVRISDNPDVDENEPEALFTAVHHAREPGSVSQMIFYMWYILEHYGSDPNIAQIINQTEQYFIPCVNPDGYIYNQTNNPNGGGMWRKNRRQNANGTYGVDINRNYGYNWGYDNFGSSGNANSSTYRGTAAFSEPETRNVRDLALVHDFQVCLNYHTYSTDLIYPWGYSDTATPDGDTYEAFTEVMTYQNNYLTGTGSETVGYTTNGDTDDWMYGEQTTKAKVLSMTPEVGPDVDGFYPPANKIINLCRDNIWQNLNMVKVMLHHGFARDNSPTFANQLNTQAHYIVRHYGLQQGALSVSVQALNNVVSAGPTKTYNLNNFDQQLDSIAITLDPNIADGATFSYTVSTSNGTIVTIDTIERTYNHYQTVMFDDFSSTTASAAVWNIPSSTFTIANGYATDSPNGNYNDNSPKVLTSRPIDLTYATEAYLTFKTRYDIDKGGDGVQVDAFIGNTMDATLCGRLSDSELTLVSNGTSYYAGKHTEWETETISLNNYIGINNFKFSFQFYNNPDSKVRDGFYVDDVKIVMRSSILGTNTINEGNDFTLTPNPAQDLVTINTNMEQATLLMYDITGQLQLSQALQGQQATFNVSELPAGVYFCRIQDANNKLSSLTKRLVVY